MKKVRAAIVGYGNIGHYVLEALQAAPDFEIAGVVRRAGAENCPAELSAYPVVKNIKELKGVDVAILCTPTRKVEEYAKEILALGIHTVDSFDIHTGITALRRTLDAEAKKHNTVSIMTIADAPWPGLTPDLLSVLLVVATQAKGSVLIHQKMFESRLFFVDKLIDMGAQIILCDPHRAVVIGHDHGFKLRGGNMTSPDIRAGIALLIAAMSADGISRIHNIEQIDRGYQNIEGRLNALGARITRIE